MSDIIVVGAGAAGLACASSLVRRGLTVTVLEARDRVGGRILTLRDEGDTPCEIGAQVVHGESAVTFEVIREAGLRATPIRKDLPFAITADGRRYTPADLVRAGADLPWTVEERLGLSAAPERPVSGLLDAGSALGHLVARAWLMQVWCADPDRLSIAGMSATRRAWRSGREDYDLPDGYDLVARHLARDLDIHLATAVDLVRWGNERVTIDASDREWTARAAVVTVPPSVIAGGGILFEPALPIERLEAVASIAVGDAVSIVAVWSERSPESGWALAASEPSGFWRVREGSRLIQGWVKGPAAAIARTLFTAPERIDQVVTLAFPWIRGRATKVRLVDWGADPYARGGFAYPVAGSHAAQLDWAAPLAGTLFFAGDASTGARHAGTVHGAIESGRRAAAEAAVALGPRAPGG